MEGLLRIVTDSEQGWQTKGGHLATNSKAMGQGSPRLLRDHAPQIVHGELQGCFPCQALDPSFFYVLMLFGRIYHVS